MKTEQNYFELRNLEALVSCICICIWTIFTIWSQPCNATVSWVNWLNLPKQACTNTKNSGKCKIFTFFILKNPVMKLHHEDASVRSLVHEMQLSRCLWATVEAKGRYSRANPMTHLKSYCWASSVHLGFFFNHQSTGDVYRWDKRNLQTMDRYIFHI